MELHMSQPARTVFSIYLSSFTFVSTSVFETLSIQLILSILLQILSFQSLSSFVIVQVPAAYNTIHMKHRLYTYTYTAHIDHRLQSVNEGDDSAVLLFILLNSIYTAGCSCLFVYLYKQFKQIYVWQSLKCDSQPVSYTIAMEQSAGQAVIVDIPGS